MLDRDRGDFINRKVSEGPSIETDWAERARRNELADLYVLVRRLRRSAIAPILIALLIGIASLGPFLGFPNDSTAYRIAVLAGLVIAAGLWITPYA